MSKTWKEVLGTGTRQSPQLDLSTISTVESSSISWTTTEPTDTSIEIETSVDGGSTWDTATNGGEIPNLPTNPTTLDIRQTLETTDTTVMPSLESLEVYVTTADTNEDILVFDAQEQPGTPLLRNGEDLKFSSTEEHGPIVMSEQELGEFWPDVEEFYTEVFEIKAIESFKQELVDFVQKGWISKKKPSGIWQNKDKPGESIWQKEDTNHGNWNKGV